MGQKVFEEVAGGFSCVDLSGLSLCLCRSMIVQDKRIDTNGSDFEG